MMIRRLLILLWGQWLVIGALASVVLPQDLDTPQTRMVPIDAPVIWYELTSVTSPVEQAALNAVQLDFPRGDGSGHRGSGVYLGDRYIATCHHVPEGTTQRGIATFRDGTRINVTVNGIDSQWDQAILTMDREHPSLPGVELATANPRPGESVYSAGFGQGFRIFGGAVTGYSGNGSGRSDWFNHQGAAVQGDSGGPMFNQTGQLVGCLWGTGQGQTIGTSTGRFRIFVKPLFPRLAQWRANRIGRQIAGVQPMQGGCYGGQCQPAAPGAREVFPSPVPDPNTDMPIDEPVNAPGEMTLQGPIGPPGPAGKDGKDGTVTDEHLQSIITAVVTNLKNDPSMRGPVGPKGDMGQVGPTGPTGRDGKDGKDGRDGVSPEIDYDELARLVAERLPPVSLALIGEQGEELDRDTVRLGGTLRLQLAPIK